MTEEQQTATEELTVTAGTIFNGSASERLETAVMSQSYSDYQ